VGRSINGEANMMRLVLEGCQFKDGILQQETVPELMGARAIAKDAGRNFNNI